MKPAFRIGQKVYHAADTEKVGIVVAIVQYVRDHGYRVSWASDLSLGEHWEHELTTERKPDFS